jgi:hypothetical protein
LVDLVINTTGLQEHVKISLVLIPKCATSAADIHGADREDPAAIRKLLHFAVQNLYDADLDEWIVIDEVSDAPGEVSLPEECIDASSTTTTSAP